MKPTEHKRQIILARAWAVRFSARDLFDIPTSLIAQRVIAAYLDGKQPRTEDLKTVRNYFR